MSASSERTPAPLSAKTRMLIPLPAALCLGPQFLFHGIQTMMGRTFIA